MRIVTIEKYTITKEQLAKALDTPKIHSIMLKDNYIKIVIHKGKKVALIYLQCTDLKGLLGLDFNILDEDIRIDKKGNIQYFREEEQLKSKFDAKKTKWCIHKILQ